MTRTENTTKRMRRAENGDVALKGVGLARSPDAQATIDPKRVSDVRISYDPGDGVSGRSDGPLPVTITASEPLSTGGGRIGERRTPCRETG